MKRHEIISLAVAVAMSLGLPTPAGAQRAESSVTSGRDKEAFVAVDAGLMAFIFPGVGVSVGASRGPWQGAVGFYRFESSPGFGGFDDEFRLFVDYIGLVQASYFVNGRRAEGIYLRAAYQAKQQTVRLKSNGAEKALTSHLVGPEVGYRLKFYRGFFVIPRVGVLYYVKSPQPGREPVQVGGAAYDNPSHKWVDAYFTFDLGFAFDL